jgi:hypothetical protein
LRGDLSRCLRNGRHEISNGFIRQFVIHDPPVPPTLNQVSFFEKTELMTDGRIAHAQDDRKIAGAERSRLQCREKTKTREVPQRTKKRRYLIEIPIRNSTSSHIGRVGVNTVRYASYVLGIGRRRDRCVG